jgi:hypothetical protein
MFKLLALFILIWIFFKALGMILKTVIGGSDANRGSNNNSHSSRKGEINVDYNPNNKNKDYKGGDYVDYEDVD